MTPRELNKLAAAEKRGAILGVWWCSCDYCGKNEGSHMHELIPRSKTVGNQEARERSYQPELCSLLCPECHNFADSDVVDKYLWDFNINLWGREAVEQALANVNEVLRAKVKINE